MAKAPTVENYGIPPRPPASTALWAHLLRKERLPPPPNSDIPIPPIAPLDKNGTSVRILLHDTQAHLEKFSSRVDTFFSSINEAKREISAVNTLFQREHETLTGEIIDLVNRSQTEIQKSLGSPAQATHLEQVSKDISNLNQRFEALDKRIDAIQTQSQTLQLHSQALQTLQDQQGTIITALMPLLPLLQAIPLHIESASNIINETTKKSIKEFTHIATSSILTPVHAERSSEIQAAKRSSSTLRSDESSPSLLKKPRLTSEKDYTLRIPANPAPASNARASRDFHHPRRQNPPITRPPSVQDNRLRPSKNVLLRALSTASGTSQNIQNLSRSASASRNLGKLNTQTNVMHNSTSTTTPLLLNARQRSMITTDSILLPHFLGTVPSTEQLSQVPRGRSITVTNTPSSSVADNPNLPLRDNLSDAGTKLLRENDECANLSSILQENEKFPLRSTPFVSRLMSTSTSSPVPLTDNTAVVSKTLRSFPLPQTEKGRPGVQSPPHRRWINPIPVRERRSPFRQGRRFIPLGDSDDEDEKENYDFA